MWKRPMHEHAPLQDSEASTAGQVMWHYEQFKTGSTKQIIYYFQNFKIAYIIL